MAGASGIASQFYFVISYDIEDDKKRRRISEEILNFGGVRVQKSVFECRLTSIQLEKLYRKLHRLREPGDSVRYYKLCRRCLKSVTADEDHGPPQDDPVQVV